MFDPWLKEGNLGHWQKVVKVKFALKDRISHSPMSPWSHHYYLLIVFMISGSTSSLSVRFQRHWQEADNYLTWILEPFNEDHRFLGASVKRAYSSWVKISLPFCWTATFRSAERYFRCSNRGGETRSVDWRSIISTTTCSKYSVVTDIVLLSRKSFWIPL